MKGKKDETKEDKLIKALEERHIIRGETRIGGQKWYELTHDRLIQPIKDSNNERKFLRKTQFYGNLTKVGIFSSSVIVAILVIAFLFGGFAVADPPNQNPIITDTGKQPVMMLFDSKNSILYTSNIDSKTISFIDIVGKGHDVMKNVTIGNTPTGIDLDANINRLYVSNYKNDEVSVVNTKATGRSQEIDTIKVGDRPVGVAVNPETKTVYVTNSNSNTISVIDGKTNSVKKTISVGNTPLGIAINQKTNTIYVTNYNDNTVSVIDGSTNRALTNVTVGAGPIDVATNSNTNMTYVANYVDDSVSIVNGKEDRIFVEDTVSPPDMKRPFDVVINPVTNLVYISDSASNRISTIDSETNKVIDPFITPSNPFGLAIDPKNKILYVAYPFENHVEKVQFGVAPTFQLKWSPEAIEADHQDNTVYVASRENKSISVLDLQEKLTLDEIDLSDMNFTPDDMEIVPEDNILYVYGSGFIAAINTTSNNVITNASASIPSELSTIENSSLDDREANISVNPSSGLIYVARDGTDKVFVYDSTAKAKNSSEGGDAKQQTSPSVLQVNGPKNGVWNSINMTGTLSDLAINPKTNRVYVTTLQDNGYSVISDSQMKKVNSSVPEDLSSAPEDIAVNPNTNKIYIANSDSISIMDGNTDTLINNVYLNTSFVPTDIYINDKTNTVYITSSYNNNVQTLWSVDGKTDQLLGDFPLRLNTNDLTFSPNGSQVYMSIPAINITYTFNEKFFKDQFEKSDISESTPKETFISGTTRNLTIPYSPKAPSISENTSKV